MRYLILSDIHANLTALDAALEAAKGRWDSSRVFGRSGRLRTAAQRSDRARSVPRRASPFAAITTRRSAAWPMRKISIPSPAAQPFGRAINFIPRISNILRNLPKGPVTIDGFSILHGALHDEDEYVFGPTQALEGLIEAPVSRLIFRPHAHPGRLHASRRSGDRSAPEACGRKSVFGSAHRTGRHLSGESRIDRPAARWRSALRICHRGSRKSTRWNCGAFPMILKMCRTA